MSAGMPPPYHGSVARPPQPPRSNTTRNLLIGCAGLLVALLLCGGGAVAVSVFLAQRASEAVETAVAGAASTPAAAFATAGAGGLATPTAGPQPELTVRNVSNYRDLNGGLWFIGEVVNNGPIEATNVRVEVRLVNDAGQTAGTGLTTSPGRPTLRVGEKTVWQALIASAAQTWKEEQVRATGQASNPALSEIMYLDLEVDSVTLSTPASQSDFVRAKGTVRNTGTSPARAILITVGLYDASGKLVAVAEGTTGRLEIAPGESAPYEVGFLNVKNAPPNAEAYARALR